jgi:hypothetical protein
MHLNNLTNVNNILMDDYPSIEIINQNVTKSNTILMVDSLQTNTIECSPYDLHLKM